MRITVSSGACAAISLFQAGPLAEQVSLRSFPRAALFHNPSLQSAAGHMVDLSGGDYFEYGRERLANLGGFDGISTRVHNRVGTQPLCNPYHSAREVRRMLRHRIYPEDQRVRLP